MNDVISPGLIEPSGSILSQRSQIVVAPFSSTNRHPFAVVPWQFWQTCWFSSPLWPGSASTAPTQRRFHVAASPLVGAAYDPWQFAAHPLPALYETTFVPFQLNVVAVEASSVPFW